jgi:myo-inositol 2-dehydrogenase / D-chiro-inositol 1-dehydrogenase
MEQTPESDMNWVLGAHPTRAVSGIGGRQVRTDKKYGNVFDHFAVEFEYPNGVRMFSQARQISNCDNMVEEAVAGTLGTSNCHTVIKPKSGKAWRFKGGDPNPYSQEHLDLIASIRAGQPINEARNVAESTMTAIIGREATYSGNLLVVNKTILGGQKLIAQCPDGQTLGLRAGRPACQ